MADFFVSSEYQPSLYGRYVQALDALRAGIPTACVLCKGRAQGGGLCRDCVDDWQSRYERVQWRCPRCKVAQLGGVASSRSQCVRCDAHPLALKALTVAFDYMMPLDSLVWRFKSHQQLRLAPVLARMMVQALWRDGCALPPNTQVAYIPTRASALKRRGFNPAAELARYVARLLGLPVAYGAFGLQQSHGSSAQKYRSQAQRWEHAQRAYTWQYPSTPSSLLLVDDVYTTGSTLHGAAYCAMQHGVENVYGVTLARVPWI